MSILVIVAQDQCLARVEVLEGGPLRNLLKVEVEDG